MDDPVQDATLAGIGANGPPTFIPVDHDPFMLPGEPQRESRRTILNRGLDTLKDYLVPSYLRDTPSSPEADRALADPNARPGKIGPPSGPPTVAQIVGGLGADVGAGLVPAGKILGAAVGGKATIFDLFKQGKTAAEIADTVGTSRQYVSKLLRDANLTNNPPGATSDTWRGGTVGVPGYPLARKGSIWSEPQHNETAVTLFNQGHQFDEIADHLSELTGSTVTKDQVAGRLKRINDENKAIDQLQEQFGPRYDRRTDPAQAAYIRYRLQRGISGAAIARELNLTPASVSNRKRILLDEADPEAAMDRDLAKSARTIPVDHDPFSTEPPPGIVAYHASPYDFEKFDFSKSGTGAGGAGYGHGGYFAENEAVSTDYRNQFDARSGAEQDAKMYQVRINARPEHFLDWDQPLSAQHPHVQDALKKLGFEGDATDLGEFAGQKITGVPRTGAHVVEDLAKRFGGERELGRPGATYNVPFADDEAASKALREAGIPGIKYLDQGSRGLSLDELRSRLANVRSKLASTEPTTAADRNNIDALKYRARDLQDQITNYKPQTHNYVVFDDRLIDILKKYGIAGLGALPAAGIHHFQTTSVDHDPFERQ